MTNYIQNYQILHPELIDRIQLSESPNCKWGRFLCKPAVEGEGKEGLFHIYAAGLNLETGDLYLDCTKKKIYAKCCTFLLVNPFWGIIKTAYHLLLPVSIPLTIYHTVKEAKKGKKPYRSNEIVRRVFVNIARNCADIVRTPLYTLVNTIVTLAAVVIGPFAPKKLYDLRSLIGKIEQSLI